MNRETIYKLRPGSKVKIREDLIDGVKYGENTFVDNMSDFLGKWVTVSSLCHPIDEGEFIIDGGGIYRYTIEMVERIIYFKYGK